MNSILTFFVIIGLIAVITYCIDWLLKYYSERAEEASQARREKFRSEAYKAASERYTIELCREELWNKYTK